MKYIIITLLILISSGLRAQDTLVSYIDIKEKKVKKRHAVFTKKVWSDNHKLWTVEIASLSGQIKEIKHYKSKKLKELTGSYLSYYKNRNKRSEGKYLKGKKFDSWTWWYKNGQLKRQGVYSAKGNKTGKWKSCYANGQKNYDGVYVDDEYHGEWKWYFENGQMSAREVYDNGKIEDIEFWNEAGLKFEQGFEIERKANFPGGDECLKFFISENIVYPKSLLKDKIQGRVVVSLVVGKDGRIGNVRVAKSVNKLLDKEAIRLVKKMPNWIPGKQHNRFVKMAYTIPINFNLN
jgi:TonB family protein